MSLAATIDSQKIADEELAHWLAGHGRERRELIVEAAVPTRQAAFDTGPRGRPRPQSVTSSEIGLSRADVLQELGAHLRKVLGSPPVELASAGAFAIEANRQEILRLLEHPLIKALRPNRRLALRKPSLERP
jgi:hypothetical protein